MARAQLFDPASGTTRFGGAELVDEWLASTTSLIWLDLFEESLEADAEMMGRFAIHPNAIEDAQSMRHPPKMEQFDKHTFFLVKGLNAETRDIAFGTIQIAIFVGERFLVTRRGEFSPSIEKLWQASEQKPGMLGQGTGTTALGLLEIVMDRFLPILRAVEARLERLEVEMTGAGRDELLSELMSLKSRLTRMRRIATYHMQIFAQACASPPIGFAAGSEHDLRDMYEKLERTTSLTTLYYDLSSDLMEGYISLASHRLNNIMKVLTVVAAIFIPLTFLAGIYGMNFQNIPELQYRYAYYILLAVMGMIVVGLVVLFRRKRWI
ncbi:MAG: magnesium transporter CorA family protein [Sphingomonadales bacterium]